MASLGHKVNEDPADVMPYSKAGLDNLHNAVSQVLNALQQANSNKNVAHLNNASQYTDAAIHHVGLLPPVPSREPARQASRTFADYRTAAEAAISDLRQKNEQLAQELVSRAEEERTRQARAEELVAELRQKVVALEGQIDADQARLRQELTNTNEAFNAKQTERETRFADWLTQQESEFSELVGPYLVAVEETKKAADAAYVEIDTLRERHSQGGWLGNRRPSLQEV